MRSHLAHLQRKWQPQMAPDGEALGALLLLSRDWQGLARRLLGPGRAHAPRLAAAGTSQHCDAPGVPRQKSLVLLWCWIFYICLLLLYSVGTDKMGKSIVIELLNTNSHLDGCAYWLMERRISFSPKQSGNQEMVILAKDSVYVALVKSVNTEVHPSWFTLQSLLPRSRT